MQDVAMFYALMNYHAENSKAKKKIKKIKK